LHSKKDIENRIYHSFTPKDKTYFPESGGKNIKRYEFLENFKEYVAYGNWVYNKPDWKYCTAPRILIREIPSERNLICCYTDTSHIPNKATIIVIADKADPYFILSILNSRLIGYYVHAKTEKGKQRLFPRISLTSVRNLPIPTHVKKVLHDNLVSLVTQMLNAKKQLAAALTDSDKNFYQNQCNSLDRQIDKLVYELYGLTDDEIKIVEGV
jgi:hypothetical protein